MSITFYVLVAIFGIALLIQIIYLFTVVVAFYIASNKKANSTTQTLPISVIVCARNAGENLKNLVPAIMNQEYHNFELIVVDDCSYDASFDILQDLKKQYTNLKTVHIKESNLFTGGKKFAVMMGIKAAEHEQLLFTDSDCIPDSNQWIQEMANQFESKSIIIGYGAYAKERSILNWLIQFDTISNAINYLGFAKIGIPFMAVGRNMAYKKSLFYEHGGFAKHIHLKSGDDDLFMNQAAKSSNVAVVVHPNSFTTSTPKRTFETWFQQKKRHLTTGKEYKLRNKLAASINSISAMVLLLSTLVLSIFWVDPRFAYLLLIRYAVYTIALMPAFYKLKAWYAITFLPLFELAIFLINFILSISNIFTKENKWVI